MPRPYVGWLPSRRRWAGRGRSAGRVVRAAQGQLEFAPRRRQRQGLRLAGRHFQRRARRRLLIAGRASGGAAPCARRWPAGAHSGGSCASRPARPRLRTSPARPHGPPAPKSLPPRCPGPAPRRPPAAPGRPTRPGPARRCAAVTMLPRHRLARRRSPPSSPAPPAPPAWRPNPPAPPTPADAGRAAGTPSGARRAGMSRAATTTATGRSSCACPLRLPRQAEIRQQRRRQPRPRRQGEQLRASRPARGGDVLAGMPSGCGMVLTVPGAGASCRPRPRTSRCWPSAGSGR